MVFVVKPDDKNKNLSIKEKKEIASQAVMPIPDDLMTISDQSKSQDQDIQELVSSLEASKSQGQQSIPETFGSPQNAPESTISELPDESASLGIPIDRSVIKGLLITLYRLPALFYRLSGFQIPEDVMVDLDLQADQLHSIMTRYGVIDVKYLDIAIFGVSLSQNMVSVVGSCRSQKLAIQDSERSEALKRAKEEYELRKLQVSSKIQITDEDKQHSETMSGEL